MPPADALTPAAVGAKMEERTSATCGGEAMPMLVQAVLRSKGEGAVATIGAGASVNDALHALAEHGIGALVVSEDGRRVDGIVSERDVVRAVAARGPAILDDTVASIMTTDVLTCGPSATVQELARLMTERRVRHVPILVDGVLGGIVSIGDVVKSRITELETETDAIREYVWNGH